MEKNINVHKITNRERRVAISFALVDSSETIFHPCFVKEVNKALICTMDIKELDRLLASKYIKHVFTASEFDAVGVSIRFKVLLDDEEDFAIADNITDPALILFSNFVTKKVVQKEFSNFRKLIREERLNG